MERRTDLDAPRQRYLIEETLHLDWLLLTKRPHDHRKLLPSSWLREPRPNVWLMTTIELQQYDSRIEEILKVPAVVHGLSIEPMLRPINAR